MRSAARVRYGVDGAKRRAEIVRCGVRVRLELRVGALELDRPLLHAELEHAPHPLFELATLGPGFGIDEDPAHLGESLILPPAFEHLRDRVERVLTPLPDPRADWPS